MSEPPPSAPTLGVFHEIVPERSALIAVELSIADAWA